MDNRLRTTGLCALVPGMLLGQTVFPGAEWEKRAPEEMGLNTNALARITEIMRETRANGVLIYKGYLVAEWNFDSRKATEEIEVQSVTKSICSMALGVALREGLIPNIDAKVKDYYPAFNAGPYTDEITFRHLVTATSGIKAVDNLQIYNADKFVKPGVESRYHNGHTRELGDALTYIFGDDLENVLRERVLTPIGTDMHWGKAGEMRLADGRSVPLVYGYYKSNWTAQNLARVGWLYANKGNWNGKQLLPAEYVAASMSLIPQAVMQYRTEARYRATDTTGRPWDPQGVMESGYGFSWWGSNQMVDGKKQWMWSMGGNFGQTCMVWPERETVLVKINTPRKPPFMGSPKLWPILIECLTAGTDASGESAPKEQTREEVGS